MVRMKLQISVRELLFIVFVAGVGLAGLLRGGWVGLSTVMMLCVLATAFMIMAFVGRGQRRAFAIGYVIPVLVYIAPHAYVGFSDSSEIDFYRKLPTSKLLRAAYEQVAREERFDVVSGAIVSDYDPMSSQPLGGGGIANASIATRERPDRATFLLLAHALWASAFAYAGGKFAVWARGRENERDTT